jgi:cytochrome b561
MPQNPPSRYHPIQVALHWLMVVLIFAAFGIGKFMSGQPNDADKLAPLALHMGLGIFTLLVVIVRFVARLKLPKPAHVSAGNPFFDWIGRVVHNALYLLVFLVALSGILLSLQAGLAPVVFGGAGNLPADFYDFTARMLHGFIAPALALLILLHIGAAFYHQLMLKHNIFARMWYGK